MLTREELTEIAHRQPALLINLVLELQERVRILENRLGMDSHNSSKPPRSDGFTKPRLTKSQRHRSGKKPGGQPGHRGNTLRQVDNPTHIIRHEVRECGHCHCSLDKQPVHAFEKRQIFEIPPLTIVVTEHQGERKICPRCGSENHAEFPTGVVHPVAYAESVQALAVYFMNQQLIPYQRTKEIFNDIFSLPISSGTLVDMNRRCAEHLRSAEAAISQQVRASEVVHFDESGLNCQKQLYWLHVASTNQLTRYQVHAKRGTEAMNMMGILPSFGGTAIHDHWQAYFDYTHCSHGLCNAHHLRELTFIAEQESEPWAVTMKNLLTEIRQVVEKYKAIGRQQLSAYYIRFFTKQYHSIIRRGLAYHNRLQALPWPEKGKRGRKKQRPGKNLLDRLNRRRKETLAFMHDFSIPFTNNLGERDIRMNRLKEKISGCFRSLEGAQYFCRIRGYISTARKQNWNILESLECAIRASPHIPNST